MPIEYGPNIPEESYRNLAIQKALAELYFNPTINPSHIGLVNLTTKSFLPRIFNLAKEISPEARREIVRSIPKFINDLSKQSIYDLKGEEADIISKLSKVFFKPDAQNQRIRILHRNNLYKSYLKSVSTENFKGIWKLLNIIKNLPQIERKLYPTSTSNIYTNLTSKLHNLGFSEPEAIVENLIKHSGYILE